MIRNAVVKLSELENIGTTCTLLASATGEPLPQMKRSCAYWHNALPCIHAFLQRSVFAVTNSNLLNHQGNNEAKGKCVQPRIKTVKETLQDWLTSHVVETRLAWLNYCSPRKHIKIPRFSALARR